MFKGVLILLFLYMQIQITAGKHRGEGAQTPVWRLLPISSKACYELTITTHRKKLHKKMNHQRYKNPYKTCSSCSHVQTSGKKSAQDYVFEGGRLQLWSGGKYEKHVTKSTTRKPTKTTTRIPTKTTIELPNNAQNEDDVQLRTLELAKKVTEIKVAALLRNNFIKVFGYILHRPQMELNSELYTSLYFILSTIKLNQVNILSMVPILKDIAFKTSNERFLKIFEAMEQHLPTYLRCAAAFWRKAIETEKVNMDNILKPNANGPLKVDILEGMNTEILSLIETEKTINDLKTEELKILYNFNINIVQIMRYIRQHRSGIQQIFFGAFILYFPKRSIQPDLEESIQLVVEFLEQEDIEEWEKYVSQLNLTKSADPYSIVMDILNKLLSNNNITMVIKESIQIILNNLVKRNPTAINPYYNSITSLVSLDKVKISYMLKYINKGAYPIEILIAGVRLAYCLKHNYIRPLTLLVHFQPYLYSSPTEVFLAILDRIIKRQPDLPAEIIDSTGAVYSHLTFEFRYIVFPAIIPDDMLNLNVLFMALRAPDIEQSFVKNVDMLISLLQVIDLQYQEMILETPVYKCATPVMCFLEVLMFIQTIIPNQEIKLIITVILESSCYTVHCPLQEPRKSNDSSLFPIDQILRIYNQSDMPPEITTLIPATTIPTTPPPSEGPIFTPTTLQSTAATPAAIPSSNDSIINKATETMPSNPTAIISIVREITLDNKDEVYVKQILKILNLEKYKAEFKKLHRETHAVFITGILMYLDVAMQELKEEFEPAVRKYLNNFFIKLKRIEDIVKLITTEKQPTRPVLATLIVAVPAPMENETATFKQLTLLLQKEGLFTLIRDNIKKENYKNIGTLLQAVLNAELKLRDKLNDEEIKAAKYYVDKIQLHGFGQGKIMWGVDVDIISQKINIGKIIDNAIGYKTLDTEKRQQVNDIIRYLKTNTPILQTWDKWIYYTKCGDFTKAMFHLLLTKGSLPPKIRKEIFNLTPLINYDKDGAQPTLEK